eukprot:3707585-Amphidinium_carterae.1
MYEVCSKLRLESKSEADIEIDAYSDSDWPGCAVTRKSTTGVLLQIHGCSIIHHNRTQSNRALLPNHLRRQSTLSFQPQMNSLMCRQCWSWDWHQIHQMSSRWKGYDSETGNVQDVRAHSTQ